MRKEEEKTDELMAQLLELGPLSGWARGLMKLPVWGGVDRHTHNLKHRYRKSGLTLYPPPKFH